MKRMTVGYMMTGEINNLGLYEEEIVAERKENEKLSIGEAFRIYAFRGHGRGCRPWREGTSREPSRCPSQLHILKLGKIQSSLRVLNTIF